MNNPGNYHIICAGINPAFDITLNLTSLQCGEVSRAYREHSKAAGKALNVCAALRRLGADAEYLCLLGEENSGKYIRDLKMLGVPYRAEICKGATRENITLLVDGYDKEFKINREGFAAGGDDIMRLERYILDSMEENRGKHIIAVFSGSMPRGITAVQYLELMRFAKSRGAAVAADTEALSKEQIEELSPWLYKPNGTELKKLFGINPEERPDGEKLAGLAMKLCEKGTENVLLTLGEKGLYLADKEGAPFDAAQFVKASEKRLGNTTGAGDRTLAGFIAAYCMGMDKAACAKIASRCGEDEEEKLTADKINGTNPM